METVLPFASPTDAKEGNRPPPLLLLKNLKQKTRAPAEASTPSMSLVQSHSSS